MERFQVMVVVCPRPSSPLLQTYPRPKTVQGPFLVTKHFLPLFKKNGTGKLIYITSKSGSIGGRSHSSAYEISVPRFANYQHGST